MEYLIVGIGGVFGSLSRLVVGRLVNSKTKGRFPVATFIINIPGAMLLGVVSSLHIDRRFTLLLADGFLGAFTTFSTFMYEGFNLFKNKERLNAYIYIAASLILGIAGFILGAVLVERVC